MERRSLPHHLLSCPSVTVICCHSDSSGDRCNVQCKRSELAKHQAGCALRMVACQQGCECDLTASEVGTHNCLQYLKQQNQAFAAGFAAANLRMKTEHNAAIATLITNYDDKMESIWYLGCRHGRRSASVLQER